MSKNCLYDKTVRKSMPVPERHDGSQENNFVSKSSVNSNEICRETKPYQEKQQPLSNDQSQTERQQAMCSNRSLSIQGAKPKQFHQLNFYGLASLSNNSNISTTSTTEPEMPSESQKYATWGGRLDKKKIIARRLQIPGTPKENGPLSPRPDDKDIRKSLQGLSSTVKKSPSGPMRPQPMRAEHSIHVQNDQDPNNTATNKGRTVLVKKFNKQMWRAPSGLPEGSEQRPFSPFGGTLPPSKIVKKKVVEVFV